MMIAVWDILRCNPDCTETDMRASLSGNLCRCTGYQGIVRAAMLAAKRLNTNNDGEG